MKDATAKERVLKNIRNALIQKNENPYFSVNLDESPYAPVDPVTEVAFAEALRKVGGEFIYCSDERDMLIQLKGLFQEQEWQEVYVLNPSLAALLEAANITVVTDPNALGPMKVGLSFCESLVARLGTVVMSAVATDGRRMIVHPEIQLIIAYASQVFADLKDAIEDLSIRYGDSMPSMVTFVTGPSRTADIEKTLVMGAHGPKQLFVFMIDDSNISPE
ncbi:MAG: LUD domain-containing protein [Bacteroidales bacterium]